MRRSPVIRAVGAAMRRHMTDDEGRLEPLFESMLDDAVPRMLPMLTHNAVTRDLAEGLVALANGRAVGGVRRTLSAVLERLSARG